MRLGMVSTWKDRGGPYMETICWDDIVIYRQKQPTYWDLYMETNIQIGTGLMRRDPPPNQGDKKLKQDWRGVKFRLAELLDGEIRPMPLVQ